MARGAEVPKEPAPASRSESRVKGPVSDGRLRQRQQHAGYGALVAVDVCPAKRASRQVARDQRVSHAKLAEGILQARCFTGKHQAAATQHGAVMLPKPPKRVAPRMLTPTFTRKNSSVRSR